MRGKSWLFEGKMLGCAFVTVALIPRREFENRRKKEKNKSTFVYVNMTEDVTLFFYSRMQHTEDHVLYLNTKSWDNKITFNLKTYYIESI